MAPRINAGLSYIINIKNINNSFSSKNIVNSNSNSNNNNDNNKINSACSSPCNSTVPSSFLCPISLSVMRDPVTLTSGITYDRASLKKWLRDGNVTCPVTMSVIGKNPNLIPNTVLKTLIKEWSKTQESVKKSTAGADQMDLRSTVDSLMCGIERLSCLTRLRRWIKTGELTKELIQEEDVVAVLLSVLKNVVSIIGNSDGRNSAMVMEDELVLQEAVCVLAMAIRANAMLQERALSDEELKRITVSTIAWVFRRSGCTETRSSAAVLVEWLAGHGSASVLEAIANSEHIINALVTLTLATEQKPYALNPNPNSVKPAILAGLRALAAIAQDPITRPAVIAGLLNYPNCQNESNCHNGHMPAGIPNCHNGHMPAGIPNYHNCQSENNRLNRHNGWFPAISGLIEHLPGSGKSLTEKILSILSSCCLFSHQARNVVRAHALAIPALIRSMLVVSELANDLAIAILWSIIALDHGHEATSNGEISPQRTNIALEAAQYGASQKLLVVAQMDCNVQTKRRINDLLKELPRVPCPHFSTSQTIVY